MHRTHQAHPKSAQYSPLQKLNVQVVVFQTKILLIVPLILFAGLSVISTVEAQINPTLQDSLAGDANNNNMANPGDIIQYKAVLQNTGNEDLDSVNYQDFLDNHTTLVNGSIKTTPLAIKDSFMTDCNTLVVDSPGILVNDFDDSIAGLEVIWNSSPTALGKMISVDSKGQFNYTPDEDLNATDSFRYAIRDVDGNIDTGVVCIAIYSIDKLVFVDNSGPNGNGTLANPYNNLSDAQSNSNPGDTMFIFEGSGQYAGGIALQDSQVLLGESEGLNSECLNVPPGNRPRITNASGHAITLAQANEIHGIIIDQPSQRGISGLNFDTLTISNTTIRETGEETVYLDTGGIQITIDSMSASNSPPNGLYLNELDGSATFRNVTISNSTQRGISITSCDGLIEFKDTTSLTNNAVNEIYMSNNTAVIDFEDVQINCIVGAAIDGHNSTGKVTIQSGLVNHSGGQILNFNNMSGGSDFSGVIFDGSSSQGMQIQNSSGGHLFGPVTITNSNIGINLSGNSGVFSFGDTTELNAQFGGGINLMTNPGATISFNHVLIDHSTNNGAGIVASGGGTLNISGGSINSGSAVALDIDGMSTSSFSFSSINTTGTSAMGLDLTNNTGTWNLGMLNIERTTGTALHASSAGSLNVPGGVLNSTNGEVMEIDDAILNMTFSSVSSSSSSTSGIQLDDISGSLTINGGSITGASGTAFDVGGVGNGSGGSAVVTYGGSITNTSGRSVFIQELAGGSYTLSGNINDTGDGIKISEINNGTAASVSLNGTSKVVNTGTSNAIELADNTNGTVNITNGGLDIDATSGIGFSSTNGGTVNVSGAGNTVSTTTGTAVDIDNATLGVSFQSVSSNGSATGISLNTTTGNFSITGLGTTDGSGGTIQNISGRGAEFINASNISLKNIQFNNTSMNNGADPTNPNSTCGALELGQNTGCNAAIHLQTVSSSTFDNVDIDGSAQQGINALDVNGLTCMNSMIENTGNQVRENGMNLKNISGQFTIQDVTIDNPEDHGIRLFNNTGSLTWDMNRTDIKNNKGVNGNDGINFEFDGGTGNLTIANCLFDNLSRDGVDGVAETNASPLVELSVQNSTFSNSDGFGGVIFGAAGTATGTLYIDNNVFLNNISTSVNLFSAENSSLNATIDSNQISHPSASNIGFGIRLIAEESSQMIISATGNTISDVAQGILARARSVGGVQSGTMDLTLKENTVSNASIGIEISAGTSSGNHGNTICFNTSTSHNAGNNNIFGSSGLDWFLSQYDAATLNLVGFSSGTVSDFIQGNNTGSPTVNTTGTISGVSMPCSTP